MKYALKNAVILDGTKDMEPLRGQSVLVEGETIVGLVPAGSEPMGFEPVDLTGKYLMPGLFNMHVHLAGSGAAELAGAFQINGRAVMPPHPSLSEFNRLLQAGES